MERHPLEDSVFWWGDMQRQGDDVREGWLYWSSVSLDGLEGIFNSKGLNELCTLPWRLHTPLATAEKESLVICHVSWLSEGHPSTGLHVSLCTTHLCATHVIPNPVCTPPSRLLCHLLLLALICQMTEAAVPSWHISLCSTHTHTHTHMHIYTHVCFQHILCYCF